MNKFAVVSSAVIAVAASAATTPVLADNLLGLYAGVDIGESTVRSDNNYTYGGYNGFDGYYGYGGYDPGYAYGPGYGPGYVVAPPYAGGSEIAYCQQRFRSYDPASGTYLGLDGYRHPCP